MEIDHALEIVKRVQTGQILEGDRYRAAHGCQPLIAGSATTLAAQGVSAQSSVASRSDHQGHAHADLHSCPDRRRPRNHFLLQRSGRSGHPKLLQPRNHIRLRQHPYINVSICRPIARKLKAPHVRHSRARLVAEGLPWLHFSALHIDSRNLQNLCATADDRHITDPPSAVQPRMDSPIPAPVWDETRRLRATKFPAFHRVRAPPCSCRPARFARPRCLPE